MSKTPNLICIIDDDPIYIFTIKKLLKINNYTNNYLVYKNGKEAIDGLIDIYNKEEALPDVILLDINMPIMDGWQFLEAYQETNLIKKTPIYIASSSVDVLDLNKASLNNLVEGYINKPLNKFSLAGLLNKVS